MTSASVEVEALDVERDLAVAGEDQPQRAGAVLAGLEGERQQLEHQVAVARDRCRWRAR